MLLFFFSDDSTIKISSHRVADRNTQSLMGWTLETWRTKAGVIATGQQAHRGSASSHEMQQQQQQQYSYGTAAYYEFTILVLMEPSKAMVTDLLTMFPC